ncbi:peptidoglycan D,D-transpeptidase FtsI family protein [Anaerosacchariphilus polymeriproducens]|nr:penicillin-binding protein 2 [Anaerosacchariphilus polymeriproducens]
MGKRKKKVSKKFLLRMQKKLIVLFIMVMLVLVGLAVRILYINIVSGNKYEKKVLSQQKYDSKVIPFRRGDIVDSKGNILATSKDVYNIILDCKIINSEEKYKKASIKALTSCFSDITAEELEKILKDKPASQYTVLRKRLSYDAIAKFVKIQNDKKKGTNVKGVWFEKEYLRSYPLKTIASNLLGFTSAGNVGNGGIEGKYNDYLNGENGREFGFLNSENNLERTVKAPTNGNTVVSTIDVNIQTVVEQKIAAFNEAHKDEAREGAGSKNTAVIVMNPNTGEVLAMADSSSYDLNNPRDLSGYYTQEEIDAMNEEETYDALNKIWRNYCITDTYEPGSTIKPFTVATGLDTGALKGDEHYFCDGFEMVGGHRIKCSNHSGHGDVTIEKALMVSCNDALMQMVRSIGKDNFCKYQGIFNFGIKTNIDLPGEARTSNLLYKVDNMGEADLATNSFGQNFNVTMIQMATAFSSLVNGGYYYKPQVVSKIIGINNNTVKVNESVVQKQTISTKTSDNIKEYLYKTVSEGTGKTAKVNGYSMGGKTGTAEKYPRGKGNYLVSFIGCVPALNPELVIYAIIDEPNVEVQSQSTYAQQLVKDILTEVLPYMNIYPDEELEESQETVKEDIPQESFESPESTPLEDPQAEELATQEANAGENVPR